MNEKEAEALAAAVGGEAWQSGGGIYVVALRRPDGCIVVFSDDLVAEYENDEAFEASNPSNSIELRTDPSEYFVVESEGGDVWMQDRAHGRGWASEEEAEHEARGIQSRVGRCWVRQQRPSDTLEEK